MNEQIEIARGYARMLWRYRWLAIAFSALVSVVGWGVVIGLPNVYEVNAKVFVDTRSMLRPLLKGLAIDNTSLSDSAMLMKRTLLTRPNLEEVARRTDLDLSAETPREFEALVNSLGTRIRLSGTNRDNIYEIAFSDSDPQRAKKVVDELLNTFLETALGTSRTDTAVTQQFLDEQIAEYEQRLIEAEERLKSFKQKNVGLMPGTGTDYFRRLEETKNVLKEATLALDEATRRRDELRRQLKAPEKDGDTPTSDPNLIAMSTFTSRIDALQSQLDQLLLQWTDKHPDVKALQSKLEDLDQKREEELKELAKLPTPTTNIQSSAGVTMELALASSSAEVAALQTRVKEYQKQLEELERLVDTVPEVEAELARLNRDYGLNRRQFEELLKRRESARISEEVDQKAEEVKLKVIEPPKVPLTPTGPNRTMYFSVVFAGALGAGAVLAFLLSQLQPRFYTVDELKEFSQIPILGAVSYQSSKRYRTERRMELAVFGIIFLGLASLYGGLVTLDAAKVDIQSALQSVLERWS